MSGRIPQRRIYLLVILSLLLTGLDPLATPAYAGFPPDDVPTNDLPELGPTQEPTLSRNRADAALGRAVKVDQVATGRIVSDSLSELQGEPISTT